MARVALILGLLALGNTSLAESSRSTRLSKSSAKSSYRYLAQRDPRMKQRKWKTIVDGGTIEGSTPKRSRFSGMGITVAGGLSAGYGKAEPVKQGATRNAMAFSVMVDKKLNETFYLCPELSYAQRGVQTTLTSFSGIDVVGKVALDYLEFPLLTKAKLNLAPRWKIFFVGGPSVSIVLHRNVEVLGLVEVDLTSRFTQFDFMLVLGGGVEYALTPDLSLVGHMRHHMGLVDIDSTDAAFFTRDIQVLVGAQFRL